MFKKIFSFFIFLLIFSFIFIFIYLKLTIPKRNGIIICKSIKDTVIIKFDEYGIPWIKTKNLNDLFFAQGFIHASERLFQMDLFRRIAEGKLSEIFGEKTFKVDSFFRNIGIKRNCEILFDSLYDIEKEILYSYSEGVNYFIEKNKGILPIEFLILRYFPEKWSPLNSLEIGKLVAFGLNFSFKGDMTFTEIRNKRGEEVLNKILPIYPEDAPFLNEDFKKEIKEFNEVVSILKNFYNFNFTSNACAIKYGPFLLNDPHLELTFPSIWFFNILEMDTIFMMGFSIPGIPLIIPGKNSKIGVGVTSLCLDEGDFIKLKKEKIDTIFEDIKIKNKIKRIKILLKENLPVIKEKKDSVIVYFWRGFLPSHEFYSIYKLYLSKNVFEAKDALRYFKMPSLNFLIVDDSENILYKPCAWIEKKKEISIFPRNDLPKEFLKDEEIPYVLNPSKGYLFSTNNPPFKNFPYYLSIYFSPSSRARRYEENLTNLKNFDFNSLKNIQNDTKSGFAKFLVEKILNVLKDKKLNKKEKRVYEILKKWDFSFDKDKIEPYIYSKIELKIIEKYFLPLLSDTLYKEFLDLFYIPLSSLEKNLKNDNISDSIILSSFKETVKEIKFEKYGKYAIAKFKHPFSNNKFLKIFFTKGPISVSGGPESPNKMGWLLSKPFEVVEGPSMRMIIDFKNNDIYIVLPPGESGNFFDKNSNNQLKIWKKGEYIKIEEKNFKNKILILP